MNEAAEFIKSRLNQLLILNRANLAPTHDIFILRIKNNKISISSGKEIAKALIATEYFQPTEIHSDLRDIKIPISFDIHTNIEWIEKSIAQELVYHIRCECDCMVITHVSRCLACDNKKCYACVDCGCDCQ